MNIRNLQSGQGLITDKSISSTVKTVAETIFDRILAEKYPIDSRLPAERNLANELGVARNTVREALDFLEDRNIISRRPGSGSFVIYDPGDGQTIDDDVKATTNPQVSKATSPLELQVMRSIIEPEMVRLAIVNMPPQEVETLDAIVSKMEAVHTDAAKYVRLEEEFFRHIAKGTGNPLLISCYELIIDAKRENFRAAQQRRHLSPDRIQAYQGRYNSLYNAIALRDIESAVEFVQLHLIDEQRLLLQED